MLVRFEISPGSRVRHANRLWEVVKIEGVGEKRKLTIFNAKDGIKIVYDKDGSVEYIQTPTDLLKANHFSSTKVFDLFSKAAKFALAYEYDKFISVSNSRTRLKPYQLDAVLKSITSLRTRFLLAADVGVG